MVELIATRNYCGVQNLVPAREETRVLRACHTIFNEEGAWVVSGVPTWVVNWRRPQVSAPNCWRHRKVVFALQRTIVAKREKGR
jgi:hypothetical protein